MSGDEPRRDRHVRFTSASTDRLGKWAEDASDEDFGLVSEALLHVIDGTWWSECECYGDVIHPLTWHIMVRPGLLVTVKFAKEYPDWVQLIYIGPL